MTITLSTHETQYLPVQLNDEEILDRSRGLASMNQRCADLEKEKAEHGKRLGDTIKGLRVEIEHIAGVVTTGEERQPVRVRKEYHSPKTGEARLIRTDTDDIVDVRSMTRKEMEHADELMQLTLPL